jgi:hypothetical protein
VASRVLRPARVGDLEVLLSRDHAELDRYARELITTDVFTKGWWLALDGARLAFAAHAEATERVFNHVLASMPTLRSPQFDKALASHRAQEATLHRLVSNKTDGARVAADAIELRALLLTHDEHDRLLLLPTLRRGMAEPDYAPLAGLYARERVRALGQLHLVSVGRNAAARADTDAGLR